MSKRPARRNWTRDREKAKRIGLYIFGLRQSLGVTQKEFAELVEVTPKTVSSWENGQRSPTLLNLEVIARELGMDREQRIALLAVSGFPLDV